MKERKLESNNKKRGIPAFFKTPLMYVFLIFGAPIGRKLGLAMNPTTPGQAGFYVAISIVICDIVAAFIGYSISTGIDSLLDQKVGRILLKCFAGVIGFFIYCFILVSIQVG